MPGFFEAPRVRLKISLKKEGAMLIVEGALFGLGWIIIEKLFEVILKQGKVILSWGAKSEPVDSLLNRRGHYRG